MIEVSCPHCGFELRIKPKYAGQEGKCVQCNGRLRVPKAGEAQIAVPVSKAAKASESSKTPAAGPPPPPMNRELRTAAGAPKSGPPVESTALADLRDSSQGRAPAKKAPPPVSTALSDLHEANDAEPAEEFADRMYGPARPRSGGQLWILIVGLAVGLPFVLFTIFAVGVAVFRGSSMQITQDGAAARPAGSIPAAAVPRPPVGPAPSPRGQQIPAYAATGLPTYPGVVFTAAPHDENPMYAKMSAIDPSTMQTFRAVTSEDNEEISKSFYLQLEAQNWTISESGMGNQANREIYIVASKGGQTLAYYTVAAGEGAAVYITLAGAAAGNGSETAESGERMDAIPIHEFPHFPGLELAPGTTLPAYTGPGGQAPDYQAAYEGTVAATVTNVSEFYKDALDGDRWGWTEFTQADEPNQPFFVKGGHGDFRYVLEGKPVARGTQVVLAFVQPGTPF